MQSLLNRAARFGARILWDKMGIKICIQRRRDFKWPGEDNRFDYQERYVEFNIKAGERVLDIGNGGDPFPCATILADKFLENKILRGEPLVTHNKPFVLADIQELPFSDKSFGFIYCSHLLEEVDDPLRACAELMRIGKRGFIETPTMGKDALFAWAKGIQKWHVVAIGQNLCFFEYSQRQLLGIDSTAWRDIVLSKTRHPLQKAFYENLDLFNVLFEWEDCFSVFLFRLDGTVRTWNSEVESLPRLTASQNDRKPQVL